MSAWRDGKIFFCRSDSESDDELFEGLDLEPVRKRTALNQEAEKGEFI